MDAGGCTDPTGTLNSLNQQLDLGPSPSSEFSNGATYKIICKWGYQWAGMTFAFINCTNSIWTQFSSGCNGTSISQ